MFVWLGYTCVYMCVRIAGMEIKVIYLFQIRVTWTKVCNSISLSRTSNLARSLETCTRTVLYTTTTYYYYYYLLLLGLQRTNELVQHYSHSLSYTLLFSLAFILIPIFSSSCFSTSNWIVSFYVCLQIHQHSILLFYFYSMSKVED